MADESTYVASMEEFSICAWWLQNGKAVEHFLGIHLKEVNAEAITKNLVDIMHEKSLSIQKLHGLGLDGASTNFGTRSRVQVHMRLHSPSAYYIHCHCHKLQLGISIN